MALVKCPYCGFLHEQDDKCPTGEIKLDPVVEKVRADLHRRSQLGIAKYGSVLADNPGDHRAKLQHAYEEMLDGANYLAWAIMEIDADKERNALHHNADRQSSDGEARAFGHTLETQAVNDPYREEMKRR